MKTKLHYVLTTAMLLFVFSAFSQTNFFVKVSDNRSLQKDAGVKSEPKGAFYQFDYEALSKALTSDLNKTATLKASDVIISFPNETGELERFQVTESSVLHPDLQAKYPEIKSFIAKSIDNPSAHMRFSLSPYNGLSAVVLGIEKALVFQPVKNHPNQILVTSKSGLLENAVFECASLGADFKTHLKENVLKDADDSKHRKYRIAISVTGEYAQENGGTLASVNGAINATLTNINAVFENDLNVSMELVATNNNVLYFDPSSDPYTSIDLYNSQVAQVLDAQILEANYDVGHLLGGVDDANGTGTGNAGCIGCVCNNGGSTANGNHKGSGFSTSAVPHGINFDINFVAHEVAHQFGATHTWTYDGNEGPNSQMEPGSGTTIMGYAGITGSYNVQLNSDPYFHAISIAQMSSFVKGTSCAVITDTGNTTPIVNAGNDLTLPIGTAFRLEGSGSDADGDVLTYCWEQFNEDNANTTYPDPNSTNSNSVLFRSFLPTESSIRSFPNLSDLRYGVNSTQWEKVPNVSRTADFRLTVRDNKLGGANNRHDDMRVTFDANYGPFEVTSQNTESIRWISGTTEKITWNVNNTNKLSGAEQVDILLSTDGGLNYGTILASHVTNNGAYTIIVPNVPAPYCRLMVVASNNYFFSINSHDFSINYKVETTCTQYSSGSNLGIAITDNGQAFTQNTSINVGASSTITDVNIGVNITHDYIGDLEFAVNSPENTQVLLKSHVDCGEEGNIIGVYDDEAPAFNCLNSATGIRFSALDDVLSKFDGENASGNWTLYLGDFGLSDVGTLNSWYVEICETTETPIDPDNPNTNENLVVFPNPSYGDFILQMYNPSKNPINIKVLDVRNQLIYEDTETGLTNLERILDLKQVQSGMYFLQVTNGIKTFVTKIIVR
ncbi:reprolysin-like metallopeptidase [Tamlana sp. I1]|uniref:zinc-dependent metalloprotease n=1 Tax=Tamlana sp. I1 TaxID=2762061 RepID=UPI00188E3DEA|nr:zinc-dependent metalloprotease family protein [Tamlana sp. I1]